MNTYSTVASVWFLLMKHRMQTIVFIEHMFILSSIGEGRLREVFLKTDNDFGGKYFAQLIKVSAHICLLLVIT